MGDDRIVADVANDRASETRKPKRSIDVPRLPDDAILLHIGLHKTGTTAVQSMFAAARNDLAAVGVSYPGKDPSHHAAALALIGSPDGFRGTQEATDAVWQNLARDAAADPARTVISSEFLSRADADTIRRFVAEFGLERTYVVVGVRHLASVALSAWQQSLKAGRTNTLTQWLKHNFVRDENGRLAGRYWEAQNPARTVQKWVDVVGPDRVFVVVIDDEDHSQLPRVFETLLGLRRGTIGDRPVRQANRSMTATEADLLRAVNSALRNRIERKDYHKLVRFGMVRRMVEGRPRGADEAPLALPMSVLELAADEGKLSGQEIEQTGARLVGDLRNLVETTRPSSRTVRGNRELPLDAAVQALVGTVSGAVYGSWELPETKPEPQPSAEEASDAGKPGRPRVNELTAEALFAVLVRRVVAGLRRRVVRIFRRSSSRH
jgi:hypothetical protein